MTTTNAVTLDEVVAYVTSHGFTHTRSRDWYDHHSGYARVVIEDREAISVTVYAFEHPELRLVMWQARLDRAPLPVFAATITAATT